MTTQTMLEKVSDSIRAKVESATGAGHEWAVSPEDIACAALQALREPTEEMEDAAEALSSDHISPYQPAAPKWVWQAMIDAILQEKA